MEHNPAKQRRFLKKSSIVRYTLAFVLVFLWIPMAAQALPVLQLGPDTGDPGWNYDNNTETWIYTGGASFTLNAYANATRTDGGNGAYGWDAAGSANQYAYLIVAAAPDLGTGDKFDITIGNNGVNLTQVASGYGAPPLEDPNSLAPHDIYDTYFEIYEFRFDGLRVTIGDTQPGQTGTGQGYNESFSISWNSLVAGLTGLHFDLFTVSGARYAPGGPEDKKLMRGFAPYSHDAQSTVPLRLPVPPSSILLPEPATFFLVGAGLFGLSFVRKRNVMPTLRGD